MNKELLQGRKIAFKALVGSHNYNLNDETSDRDYKYFVLPNFDDLYNNNYFSIPSQVSATIDFDVHEVRKIPMLWYKANINFLEVLFSNEKVFNNNEIDVSILHDIFAMKDKIAKMNIPYLFHACKGMHFKKMALLNKGTSGTQHLVDKFGYDTKQALHAYRVPDFLERFYYTDFNDFKQAITYSGNDREFMLAIKQGVFSERDFRLLVAEKLNKVLTLESVYDNIQTDEETHKTLQHLIKELVRNNL